MSILEESKDQIESRNMNFTNIKNSMSNNDSIEEEAKSEN